MAKVKIQGHASGTGVLTVTAPNTSTDRTITLPDGDVTLGAATPSIDDNGNATAITIDASENVGIGTTSPETTAHISKAVAAGSDNLALRIQNPTNASDARVGIGFHVNAVTGTGWDGAYIQSANSGSDSGDLRFGSVTNNTLSERMRIQSGGGISFNGDTAAANALDDYEEGTWTPVPAGGTLTISDLRTATYTKIGNTVNIQCYIATLANGDSTAAAFSGLPFTSGTNKYCVGGIDWNEIAVTNPHIRIESNSTQFGFYKNASTNMVQTEINGGHLIFSATYFV